MYRGFGPKSSISFPGNSPKSSVTEVFLILAQRKTQTLAYWQDQFSVSEQDIEFVYNKLVETNRILDLHDIAITIVQRHCEAEEIASRSELQQGKAYQPNESYAEGDPVVFPLFDFAVGTVAHTRAGHHPDYGTFTVIGVTFENSDSVSEFAADFHHDHPLNLGSQSLANLQGLMSPEEIFETYQTTILPKAKLALDDHHDFVEFHEQYFLADLLSEFHEGLFNIADAAIDINQGPLAVDALIEQMGLAEAGDITDNLRFSVNYRLDSDERFDDVGPAGQVSWYLERLEPPEAHHPPRRLQISEQTYDINTLDDELRKLVAEIDDEATHPEDIPEVGPDFKRVTLTLNYPHRRVGTLPLTPKTQSFFPISYYNPVLFQFVDGRTGNTFPGWVVQNKNYVYGLNEWYTKNNIPVGGYIDIKRTDDALRVIIDFQPTRTQRDWIRMAVVSNHQLSFQMNKEAIKCKYDELMIIGDSNQADVDRLWLAMEDKEQPIFDILCHIFPELSKLNPQSTVHAKTLYNAVNVICRAAPGAVFQTLVSHTCFVPMNHGYWTYNPDLKE